MQCFLLQVQKEKKMERLLNLKTDNNDFKIVDSKKVYRLVGEDGKKYGYVSSAICVESFGPLEMSEDSVVIGGKVVNTKMTGSNKIVGSCIKNGTVFNSTISEATINSSEIISSKISYSNIEYMTVQTTSLKFVESEAPDVKKGYPLLVSDSRQVCNSQILDSKLLGFFNIKSSDMKNCVFGICNGDYGYYVGPSLNIINAGIRDSADIIIETCASSFGKETFVAYRNKNNVFIYLWNQFVSDDIKDKVLSTLGLQNVFVTYDSKVFYKHFIDSLRNLLKKDSFDNLAILDQNVVDAFCNIQIAKFAVRFASDRKTMIDVLSKHGKYDISSDKFILPYLFDNTLLLSRDKKEKVPFILRYHIQNNIEKCFCII